MGWAYAGGWESGAVGQHPSTAMPRMTPGRGCLCIWWEALCEEAPRGSVSSGGPRESSAPGWSRICPGEGQGLPPSPHSFLLWHIPQAPTRALPLVPLAGDRRLSYCATDQSRMRAQERLEGEADGSMFPLINEPRPPSIAGLH